MPVGWVDEESGLASVVRLEPKWEPSPATRFLLPRSPVGEVSSVPSLGLDLEDLSIRYTIWIKSKRNSHHALELVHIVDCKGIAGSEMEVDEEGR